MNKNMNALYGITLGITSLFLTSNAYSEYRCETANENGPTCGRYSNNSGNVNKNQSSLDQAASVINALTPALQQWAAKKDAERIQEEKESELRKIKQQQQEQENKRLLEVYLDQADKNIDTNPWANSSAKSGKTNKDQVQPKKQDTFLGNCVEQNFSSQSNGKFALKNTCRFPINLKYTFSSSKPLHGTYITLQPNQLTFETGNANEKIIFYMCPVPKTPQTLNGGCI